MHPYFPFGCTPEYQYIPIPFTYPMARTRCSTCKQAYEKLDRNVCGQCQWQNCHDHALNNKTRLPAPKRFCRKCGDATKDFGQSLCESCQGDRDVQVVSPSSDDSPPNPEEEPRKKQSSTKQSKVRLPPIEMQNRIKRMLAARKPQKSKIGQDEDNNKMKRKRRDSAKDAVTDAKGKARASTPSSVDSEMDMASDSGTKDIVSAGETFGLLLSLFHQTSFD